MKISFHFSARLWDVLLSNRMWNTSALLPLWHKTEPRGRGRHAPPRAGTHSYSSWEYPKPLLLPATYFTCPIHSNAFFFWSPCLSLASQSPIPTYFNLQQMDVIKISLLTTVLHAKTKICLWEHILSWDQDMLIKTSNYVLIFKYLWRKSCLGKNINKQQISECMRGKSGHTGWKKQLCPQ